jgi:Protein of unknown function (DUF2510)
MTSSPTTPPAGWYANGPNAGQYRWWDGQHWTEYVHEVSAVPVATAELAGPAAGAGYQPWRRRRWMLVPGAVVGLLLAVSAATNNPDNQVNAGNDDAAATSISSAQSSSSDPDLTPDEQPRPDGGAAPAEAPTSSTLATPSTAATTPSTTAATTTTAKPATTTTAKPATTTTAKPATTTTAKPATTARSKTGEGCDPNYSGACVPVASDVDCAGGSGNGPAYVAGPVKVIGRDIYDLDGNDNDGIGCE